MTIKKLILIACAILIAIVAVWILVYRMLTGGHVEPLALLLLAAVISIMLPMIRANFFPSARDCGAEFDFHVRRRDAFIRQQIADNLGPTAFQRISAEPDASNEGPDSYLSALLEQREVGSNMDLHFALLAALSQYYEKTGDPQAAIKSLTEAQQLRPRDFVTRFNLAHNYEWLGNPAEARRIYRRIIDTPAGLSRAMIKLTRRRMEELEER